MQINTYITGTNGHFFFYITVAEFTRRPKELRICWRRCFTMTIKFLLPQELLKSQDFLRESGANSPHVTKKWLKTLSSFYKETNNKCFAFNAKFRREHWLFIICICCFTKYFKFLLMQLNPQNCTFCKGSLVI